MTGKPDPNTTALTIAGFDPSSGAGITADLAVFAAHGIYGTSAITALTVQSTTGVRRVEAVRPEMLLEALTCLEDDLPPDGIKIGMLSGTAQVSAVSRYVKHVRERRPQTWVVLDTVLRSSSGAELLSSDGLESMQRDLLPLADVVTPNTVELALLTGSACTSEDEIESACRMLANQYPRLSILATGGHRSQPDDVLLHGGVITVLPGEWIDTRATHGTGCALSSALLCGLLRGQTVPNAAAAAKSYVAQAMRSAIPRGLGNGPLNLLWCVAGQTSG